MANKKFWLGILVMVLVFGMTVVGCEEETQDDVTVTFDANGGRWADSSTTKSVKVPYDSDWDRVKVMVSDPIRQGYSFKEWLSVANPAPNTIYSMGNFNRDRTVYAQWTDVDTWTNVTSLSQVNGTWKSSSTETETLDGMTTEIVYETTMTINASAGTMSMSVKTITTFSGSGINMWWPMLKQELSGEDGITINDSNHSITMTQTMPPQPINSSEIAGFQINQNGTKVKQPADEDGSPEIIFTKQ